MGLTSPNYDKEKRERGRGTRLKLTGRGIDRQRPNRHGWSMWFMD